MRETPTRRIDCLAAALGAVLLAKPALVRAQEAGRGPIILVQGGTGADSGGGVSSGAPGSPGAGNLGSTPQVMQGRSQRPAQGAAVPLAPSSGRGGPDPSATPGAMPEAPGGTGVMPGDRKQPRR